MKTTLAVLAAGWLLSLVIVGCYGGASVGDGGKIQYYHDDAHAVSCWTTYDKSIACLPDSQVKR